MGQNILILDDLPFSSICSAILELEGYETVAFESATTAVPMLDGREIGLIIASYPYSNLAFEKIHDYLRILNIPVLILCDSIEDDLIRTLRTLNNSYCMIKPLDYQKFRNVVKRVMNGELVCSGGYKIV